MSLCSSIIVDFFQTGRFGMNNILPVIKTEMLKSKFDGSDTFYYM